MAQNIVFPEWLNANSLRSYPIRENATRTDLSGNFTIPNDLLVAAQINCPRSCVSGEFYISRMIVGASFVSLYIGFAPSVGDPVEVAYIKAEQSSFKRFSYYSFVGQDDLSSVLGYLTIGDISSTIESGAGEYQFASDSTPFEVNTYFVSVPALESVEILSSNGTVIHRATEVLRLKAGENIRMTYEPGTDPYGTVRIDAINGANLIQQSDCANTSTVLPPPIRQINGVGPDQDGKFWIEESECIEITGNSASNSISILDKCAKSCCGCEELEQLTTSLEALKLQEQALRDLVTSTQTQQSELLANIITNINS